MEYFNQAFFLWLNAPEHPSAIAVTLASVFAEWLIWAIPALLCITWLRGNEGTRRTLLIATASGVVGMLVNQLIGLVWMHPRPFMMGLGHRFIPHVADSSFPSDHLTLWWATTFSLLFLPRTRRIGVLLSLLGVPVAWARIYLGVHFPFDMLGSITVAMLSARLAWRAQALYLDPIYQLAIRIHSLLFGKLIALGWIRK